jgi:hypothetical protein
LQRQPKSLHLERCLPGNQRGSFPYEDISNVGASSSFRKGRAMGNSRRCPRPVLATNICFVFRNASDSCLKRPVPGTYVQRHEVTSRPFSPAISADRVAKLRSSYDHCNGLRSFIIVGRSSETVGWMCIARCRTVKGAFAYMRSRLVWITSSPPTPKSDAPSMSWVSRSTRIFMKP